MNILQQQNSCHDSFETSKETIASRFERQVAAAPDGLAIVTDEVSLTYRALDLKSSRIAAVLASLPSQRDRPIVLLMKDEAARIAVMLGALKANRICVPLAPNSLANWVAQVIEGSRAAHIIVDGSTRSIAEPASTAGVTIMDVGQLAQSSEPFAAGRTASSDDTALVVYTSGSTGQPKGVANSNSNLIRRCDLLDRFFGLGRGGRYANWRTSGLSSGTLYSLLPLLSGGCLFPFDLHHHGLQKLAPWLVAQEITFISFSSSLLRTWLASLPDNLRFPALRFVGLTSERLYAEDVIRLVRHLEGDWRVGHRYSSTESGFVAAQMFTPTTVLPHAGIVAVGRPVDGVEVSLKDETGALVAPGETGEIVLRGRFLGQGYWNNPELTAKTFHTDTLDSSIRVYRTGDLGRWRSDGMLEHIGRKGRRIRLRGYNVEPYDVECELMRQPGVTDAVVLLHDGADGQQPCLVGYVVAPTHASPSTLRKGLAERLPSYMVPSHIIVLDSFPLLNSGKVDRNALPTPYRGEAREVGVRAGSDNFQHELLVIWQDALKIPKIGIDDDFFELGGTSLQALMVFARIKTRLGFSLSPTTIVQAPTVARLAEFIRATTGSTASQSLVPLRASGTGLPLFLVHGRYCFLMNYGHLVSDLKSDRPIFGLQPPPLDGKHGISRTIESMATDYVAEIRRVQPHGPYCLAGHSFGGRVSFEIAQQFVREGERVSFLGLIDTILRDPLVGPKQSKLVRFSHKFRRVHSFQDLLFRGLRSIKNAILVRQYDRWIRQGRSIPYEHQPVYYDWLFRQSNRGYVPTPYTGHITMFSSAGNSEQQRAHWEPLGHGGLTVIEVPAGHDDMILPPQSKIVAEHFDACLGAISRAEELVHHGLEKS